MTQAETAKIIFLLKELYPHSTENTTIENRVRAWYIILKDYDFDAARNAAIEYAKNDSKGFFPAVGQIIAELEKAQPEADFQPDDMYKSRVLGFLEERRLLQ